MTAAFTNVPRRRRTAGSVASPPPKEEELGAEATGRDHSASSPAPSRVHGAVAPPATTSNKEPAPPPSSRRIAAAPVVGDPEELRRLKGKMVVADESPPRESAAGAKLMGDAMRAHAPPHRRALAPSRTNTTKPKKRKDRGPVFWFGMGSEGQSTSSAGSAMAVSLDDIAVVSNRLRATLNNLGGSAAPVRVYGKMMSRSDRASQQSRLLMSCKSWRAADDGPFPLDVFLSAAEKAAAHGEGLAVRAFDRRGDEYAMRLRYLPSNFGYRLIAKWGEFLKKNGLVEKAAGEGGDGGRRRAKEVMIDLWFFHTPDGKVAMVLMHYRKGDAAHADAALEEEMGKRRTIRRKDTARVASPAPEQGVAVHDGDDIVMEDAGGGPKEEEDGAMGEVTAPSSSNAGAAKAAEEDGGAHGETMATSASDSNGVKDEKAGVQGEEAAPSSSDGERAKAAVEEAACALGEVTAPSSSPGSGVKAVEETSAQGEVANPSSSSVDGARGEPSSALSRYTQQDVEAAQTLVLISQGCW